MQYNFLKTFKDYFKNHRDLEVAGILQVQLLCFTDREKKDTEGEQFALIELLTSEECNWREKGGLMPFFVVLLDVERGFPEGGWMLYSLSFFLCGLLSMGFFLFILLNIS